MEIPPYPLLSSWSRIWGQKALAKARKNAGYWQTGEAQGGVSQQFTKWQQARQVGTAGRGPRRASSTGTGDRGATGQASYLPSVHLPRAAAGRPVGWFMPRPGLPGLALQKHGGWQEERHSLQARERLAREGNLHRAPCRHRPLSRRQVGGGELECKKPSLHPPASSSPAPPPSFSLFPPPLPSRCHLPAQGQNRYLRAPRPSRSPSPALPRSVRRCLCRRRLQPHARALQRPRRQLRPLWGPRATPLTGPASPHFACSVPLLSAPHRRAPM